MNQSHFTTNITSPRAIGRLPVTSGGRSGFSPNVAYIHLTSGSAIAIRYMAKSTNPIDAVYFFLDDVVGTLGSITMECQIYNENTTLAARPGSTLRDTSTATTMPGAVDRWIKFTFGTPYTPAIGEVLWFVIYNTSGAPGTDYPTVMINTNFLPQGSATAFGYSTTTGFTSNGSALSEMPFVIEQGAVVVGQPFTQFATIYANNTLERGLVITPSVDTLVCGLVLASTTTALDALVLRADATAPGGAAIATWDLDSDANQTSGDVIGAKVFANQLLSAGVTYKALLTFTGSATTPTSLQIEDYASYSALFDTLRNSDTLNWPWSAVDDGAGGWTIDKSVCPGIQLLVQDEVASAGSLPFGGLQALENGVLA